MNQVQLYDKIANSVDAIDAIERLGDMFASSGMFGCQNPSQGRMLALASMIERKSPLQIVREYNLIDGRLTDRADSMLAKFVASGGKYKIVSRTPDLASVELARDGNTAVFSVAFEEMKAEPFIWMADGKTLKKNWRTPRARMQTLWARAISDGVRTMAPEIVCGIVTPEEAADEAQGNPGPTLNLGTPTNPPVVPPANAPAPQPATTIPAKTPTPIRESEKSPVEKPAPIPATPQPKSEPIPAPVPASAPVEAELLLSDELLTKVESVIGAHGVAALAWLRKNAGLKEGGGLANISPKTAQSIISRPEAFIRAILPKL